MVNSVIDIEHKFDLLIRAVGHGACAVRVSHNENKNSLTKKTIISYFDAAVIAV